MAQPFAARAMIKKTTRFDQAEEKTMQPRAEVDMRCTRLPLVEHGTLFTVNFFYL
jgi:hypothetical protein